MPLKTLNDPKSNQNKIFDPEYHDIYKIFIVMEREDKGIEDHEKNEFSQDIV